MTVDAVVVGAGPNGLVAANLLADRGWDVLVLEEQDQPGGAVRSAQVAHPGYEHDLFSAFYPLAAASPVIRALGLEDYGVRWRRSQAAVAHPHHDGRCALLSTDLKETCASLEEFAAGDGDAWRELYGLYERIGRDLISALMTPLPPIRAGARIAMRLRTELPEFARFCVLPVRRLAEERFRGDGAAWLLAGNALHADLTPESAAGGLYGWLLCALGQRFGFPVPEGGAGRLTDGLVRRLRARGGEIRCGTRVDSIEVAAGRARAAIDAQGQRHPARRAVVADTGVHALYERLLPAAAVPDRVRRSLRHLQLDNSTVKVNWALRAPIPWSAAPARTAGTIHVAEGMDGLSAATTELARGLIPERPFLVLGQYAPVDPTRAPGDGDAAWAYTHVPQRPVGDGRGELTGSWDEQETTRFRERMEDEVERLAPGFRDLIVGSHTQTPADLEAADANLVGGAINGGTAQIHQQAIFRPLAGLGRPTTPVRGLYLASSAVHPGGGVHGGPGANAARVALRRGWLARA
ncbi:MAG TPA: NAD(P)/FAD-dependent oxidoreductase [Solirubrobacterales bacterium]|nr:NAD(P)/FAD-dependent oxidoreductase [Solirubrobacterales bacterium]